MTSSLTSWSQENWSLISDLNESWFYYDEEWLPVTDQYEEYDAIFFRIDQNNHIGKHLVIKYPGQFSLFLNDQVIAIENDSLNLSLENIYKNFNWRRNSLFSIHTERVRAQNLETLLMARYQIADEPEVKGLILIESRDTEYTYSFFGVIFLAILVIIALIKFYYPKNLSDFYNISKTLSARDVEEGLLRGRLFSQINVMIMIFQCFIAGLFISLLLIHMGTISGNQYSGLLDYAGLWFNISMLVALFIFIKFILIRNFTSLYDIGNFSTPHFMTYLRITSIIFGLAALLLYVGIYALEWETAQPFQAVLDGVLILMAISIIFIYIKLINSARYKLLHLFSYLCATEILPYVVVLKVAINHSI